MNENRYMHLIIPVGENEQAELIDAPLGERMEDGRHTRPQS